MHKKTTIQSCLHRKVVMADDTTKRIDFESPSMTNCEFIRSRRYSVDSWSWTSGLLSLSGSLRFPPPIVRVFCYCIWFLFDSELCAAELCSCFNMPVSSVHSAIVSNIALNSPVAACRSPKYRCVASTLTLTHLSHKQMHGLFPLRIMFLARLPHL